MNSTLNFLRFVPTAGEETAFFSFELTGVECFLKGPITPKGSLFVQTQNATGTQALRQRVQSSSAINATGGGSFHVGPEAATLEATIDFFIEDANGESTIFGTH